MKSNSSENTSPAAIFNAVADTFRLMADSGTERIDCSPQTLEILDSWSRPLPTRAGGGRETLEDIQRDLGDCVRCRLAEKRRHIVFGQGDPSARLVFVGEGPGRDEDVRGVPFVGPAGRLLTKIIEAMKLDREQVYICNIVKCRPPNNRNPEPDEIETCIPFLKRQLAAIEPEFVCALGAVAAQSLLETGAPISRLRGRIHEIEGLKVMPTYHPSYLLRNPSAKRDVWSDVQIIMREMVLADS